MAVRAFLDLPTGMVVRIGPAGLLVGRHRSCDLQLTDESASRRHAFLRLTDDGVELAVLGKQPVLVGATPCSGTAVVQDGDPLAFPGFTCRIRIEPAEDSVRVAYCLRQGNDRLPIHVTPFVVGIGEVTDALRFSIAQGALYVESRDASVNGAAIEADQPVALALGDTVTFRDRSLVVEQAESGDDSTVLGQRTSPHASAVVLEPLPRGGRVTFTFSDGARAVFLPGRRYLLVAALLQPPKPYALGEFIPDHELVPLVWNDDDEVGGRQDLNVVITRCRRDLITAGIAAATLFERAPGGRATRIVLAPNATVRSANE